jgi:protein O-GlcNAc transferase
VALSVNSILQEAVAALQAGQSGAAERLFKKLLAKQPRHVGGLNLISILLTRLKRFDEAEHYVRRAIQENSSSDVTFYNYGLILKALGRPTESLQQFDRALKLNATVAETWNNRGTVLNDIRRYSEAIGDFDKAISLNPNYAEAFVNKAKALVRLGLHDQAFDIYGRAIVLKPDLAEAWLGRGNLYLERDRHAEALIDYDRALSINPELQYAEGSRLFAKLSICDWGNLTADMLHLLAGINDQKPVSFPFPVICMPSSPADQLRCAKRYVADEPEHPKLWRGERYSHERIRIAYISADFHNHATAQLMAGLFEQHDKTRFDLTALSFGPDQDSNLRHRIKRSFERFIDVRPLADEDVAKTIRSQEIDIAIDLKGFTQNARTNIFARRPAPVQVNYLGYPGTMGSDHYDYIIADQTVIPPDQCEFYSEKVVWLPDSYQVNDARRRISERTPSRRDCTLPEQGFVFCCFNNTFKITPEVFDVWMRLLKANQNSILWLIEGHPAATANLRREAENRGVAPDRLIFAPRLDSADHLARHRLADLFLDTLPCNAHTTASDALWAGLPVLTCLGPTFAGRVAGSLLQAIGLAELATTTLSEYEALALKLAREPAFLASIKEKLTRHRSTHPLFNTARFARHIESAYTTMWERHQKGEIPLGFAVEPLK